MGVESWYSLGMFLSRLHHTHPVSLLSDSSVLNFGAGGLFKIWKAAHHLSESLMMAKHL